jgi:hypothetical protein
MIERGGSGSVAHLQREKELGHCLGRDTWQHASIHRFGAVVQRPARQRFRNEDRFFQQTGKVIAPFTVQEI